MSAEVPVHEQGRLQGALASLVAMAETLGPLLFTQVYAAAITTQASWLPAGAPYLVAAVLQVAAIFVTLAAARRTRVAKPLND